MPIKKQRKPTSEIKLDSHHKLNIHQFKLTDKQKKFLKIATYSDTKITFMDGPAGSSKTMLSVIAALQLFNIDNKYEIKYIRTIAESADKHMGSLPGDVNEKINPFLIPLQEKLDELLPENERKQLLKDHVIQSIPINFVRGSSWKDKIIIIDESQNFSTKELITALTRIGEGTRIFVCGDSMQSDINSKSGFLKVMNVFDNLESQEKGIHCFKFEEEDIMRSEILRYLVTKFKTL